MLGRLAVYVAASISICFVVSICINLCGQCSPAICLCLSVCLSYGLYLFIYHAVFQSVWLSICLSNYPYVYLQYSICQLFILHSYPSTLVYSSVLLSHRFIVNPVMLNKLKVFFSLVVFFYFSFVVALAFNKFIVCPSVFIYLFKVFVIIFLSLFSLIFPSSLSSVLLSFLLSFPPSFLPLFLCFSLPPSLPTSLRHLLLPP